MWLARGQCSSIANFSARAVARSLSRSLRKLNASKPVYRPQKQISCFFSSTTSASAESVPVEESIDAIISKFSNQMASHVERGEPEAVFEIFNEMVKSELHLNGQAYAALIAASAQSRDVDAALSIFNLFQSDKSIPQDDRESIDSCHVAILKSLYSSSRFAEAQTIFNQYASSTPKKEIPLKIYNTVLLNYALADWEKFPEAPFKFSEILTSMSEHFKIPNMETSCILFRYLGRLGDSDRLTHLFRHITHSENFQDTLSSPSAGGDRHLPFLANFVAWFLDAACECMRPDVVLKVYEKVRESLEGGVLSPMPVAISTIASATIEPASLLPYDLYRHLGYTGSLFRNLDSALLSALSGVGSGSGVVPPVPQMSAAPLRDSVEAPTPTLEATSGEPESQSKPEEVQGEQQSLSYLASLAQHISTRLSSCATTPLKNNKNIFPDSDPTSASAFGDPFDFSTNLRAFSKIIPNINSKNRTKKIEEGTSVILEALIRNDKFLRVCMRAAILGKNFFAAEQIFIDSVRLNQGVPTVKTLSLMLLSIRFAPAELALQKAKRYLALADQWNLHPSPIIYAILFSKICRQHGAEAVELVQQIIDKLKSQGRKPWTVLFSHMIGYFWDKDFNWTYSIYIQCTQEHNLRPSRFMFTCLLLSLHNARRGLAPDSSVVKRPGPKRPVEGSIPEESQIFLLSEYTDFMVAELKRYEMKPTIQHLKLIASLQAFAGEKEKVKESVRWAFELGICDTDLLVRSTNGFMDAGHFDIVDQVRSELLNLENSISLDAPASATATAPETVAEITSEIETPTTADLEDSLESALDQWEASTAEIQAPITARPAESKNSAVGGGQGGHSKNSFLTPVLGSGKKLKISTGRQNLTPPKENPRSTLDPQFLNQFVKSKDAFAPWEAVLIEERSPLVDRQEPNSEITNNPTREILEQTFRAELSMLARNDDDEGIKDLWETMQKRYGVKPGSLEHEAVLKGFLEKRNNSGAKWWIRTSIENDSFRVRQSPSLFATRIRIELMGRNFAKARLLLEQMQQQGIPVDPSLLSDFLDSFFQANHFIKALSTYDNLKASFAIKLDLFAAKRLLRALSDRYRAFVRRWARWASPEDIQIDQRQSAIALGARVLLDARAELSPEQFRDLVSGLPSLGALHSDIIGQMEANGAAGSMGDESAFSALASLLHVPRRRKTKEEAEQQPTTGTKRNEGDEDDF